ncbi:Fe(2+) transporter permease subunit FeoB [Kistimonas asteriae]|uniref:Fe(2+) transporter permease subunit FeoB n=1 Tax=Kistimonas asteriae TaxID=517724 RepID=UPI001BA4C602|nr:Fe(2+) transporter permease subunit FeoB [Kistimonas asteriae]
MSDSFTVAVVGNPNAGKTSLFNAMTGARQRVGNWPGVTVEKKTGEYQFHGKHITLVDLPGTYSLDVISEDVSLDERIARDYVLASHADLIINIVDASNFERNLYLTTQLLEMKQPVVVVLNMMDMLKDKGMELDVEQLERLLGCPVVPVVASRSKGIEELQEVINRTVKNPAATVQHNTVPSEDLHRAINQLAEQLAPVAAQNRVESDWLTLKLLEGDSDLEQWLDSDMLCAVNCRRTALEETCGEDADILIADARYRFISNITTQVLERRGSLSKTISAKIDAIVLNRMLGLPIFLGVMYLMFLFTIQVGSAFIDFFDIFTGTVLVDGGRYVLTNMGAPEFLITLLADGVGAGIQTVSTFIPVIACLFLFLSILEDSGYMARAAFVIDRAMNAIGLPGKSFVSLLVGFGCNVPSIMGARTMENPRDRMLSIMMAPFMSCGARLPVYVLFAAAFFPYNGQNVVFALYLIGIAVAVMTAVIMKRTLLPGETSPFIMELPDYHRPLVRQVLLRTWDRLKVFILGAGKIIVLVVTVLGVLNSMGTDGTFGNENTDKSVLSEVGRTITPVFSPMGMTEENWPAAVGIFTGIFAKEAVVGTLDAMYSQLAGVSSTDAGDEYSLLGGVKEALATIPENLVAIGDSLSDPLGIEIGVISDSGAVAEEQGMAATNLSVMQQLFATKAAAIAYLLLILLYTPCVAALGAIYRETSMRWTVFIGSWTFFMGYLAATLYYQASIWTQNPVSATSWIAGMLAVFIAVILGLRRFGSIEMDNKVPVTATSGKSCCSS